jgi:hypothetical protein
MWNCTVYAQELDTYGLYFLGDFWLVKTDENGVVPEYSSLIAPSLILATAAPILFYRKKMLKAHS